MSTPQSVEATGPTIETRQKSPKEITDELNVSPRLRLIVTLCFPLVLLLAVPFWWYTTSIERLPLLVDRIEALTTSQVSLTHSSLSSSSPFIAGFRRAGRSSRSRAEPRVPSNEPKSCSLRTEMRFQNLLLDVRRIRMKMFWAGWLRRLQSLLMGS
jgi:hypothetical protein